MSLLQSRLEGQIALVTGASSGIGRAITFALAARGVSLALVGRDIDRLLAVAEKAGNSLARCYQLDLSEIDAPLQLAQRVSGDFGRMHLLIHSAGQFAVDQLEGPATKILDQLSQSEPHSRDFADTMDRLYAVNVRAPHALTYHLLPLLVRAKGQVVFVNSSAVRFPKANLSAYIASKQALLGLTDCLRAQVNDRGVRVLSVFPGRTATPLQERLHEAEGQCYQPERLLQPEDVASVVLNALEIPRTAEITEIHIRPMNRSGFSESASTR